MSLLAAPGSLTRVKEAFMFANFSFTTIQSSFKISLVFVFLRVRSEPELAGEESLVSDSLSLRRLEVFDNGRGAILLGVGVSFAIVPIVDFAFTTLALGLAELAAWERLRQDTHSCRG